MVRGTLWKVRGAVLVVRILPWIRIFCNVHLFRVPRSWTGGVEMKSSMTFIRGNSRIEKDTFKSREVKCLKECALALTSTLSQNNFEHNTVISMMCYKSTMDVNNFTVALRFHSKILHTRCTCICNKSLVLHETYLKDTNRLILQAF